jgi:protein disulfide-isomerase
MSIFFLFSCLLFGSEATWLTDLETAKQKAASEGKPILINFSGSDWCGWCKRLDREIFEQQGFIDFAKEELVLVNLDFPKRKRLSPEERAANEAAARTYGVQGFPTVLLIDPTGKVLLRTGYQSSDLSAYIRHIKDKMPVKKS